METKKKTKAATAPKIITFDSLKALKISKGKKSLPRGITAMIWEDKVTFRVPKQTDPVLTIPVGAYAEACLKADGFKFVT